MAESGLRHRLSPTTSQKRRVLAEWPILTVIAGVLAGMLLLAGDRVVAGTTVMGLSMWAGALLRLLVPTRMAGVLAVRRRVVDVSVYGGTGFLLILLGLMVHGMFSAGS